MNERRRGFSFLEYVVIIVVIAICILIAWPNIVRAKISSNQKSAVSMLKTLAAANSIYMKNYKKFPDSLKQVKNYLTNSEKEVVETRYGKPPPKGYYFVFNIYQPYLRFLIFAVPEKYNETGCLSFVVNERGEVFEAEITDLSQEKIKWFERNDFGENGKAIWKQEGENRLKIGDFEQKWQRTLVDDSP